MTSTTFKKRTLADLVAAFDEPKGENANAEWKKFFPFYKMNVDTTTIIRFLPDLDEDNPLGFMWKNVYHELVVNGRKERVACLKHLGLDCPACRESERLYAADDKVRGKALYRKVSYLAQCLILDTQQQLREDAPLVHLIDFGDQIYKKVIAGMKSGDLQGNPSEFKAGYNFRIRKTLNGRDPSTGKDINTYNTSDFSQRETDIDDETIDLALEQMCVLSEHGAKQVDASIMETMVQTTLAHLGVGGNQIQRQAPVATPVATAKTQSVNTAPTASEPIGDDNPEVGAAPTEAPKKSAKDIIRERAERLRAQRGE